MGIGRDTFKIWLTASICWMVAVGIAPYAGGLFPAQYQTEFPLRPVLVGFLALPRAQVNETPPERSTSSSRITLKYA